MVFSSAVPSEPPTCWEVLTIAEATPASCGPTPVVARFIAGMNATPSPRPSSSCEGSTDAAYGLSTRRRVSSAMPAAATMRPGTISSRAGTRFISRAEICVDPAIMPAVIGRNARPVLTGE